MKIDKSQIVRAVVERVDSKTGEVFALTSGNTRLTLSQYDGMYPYSPHEWIPEGSTPVKPEDVLILFEQDERWVWVHADEYGKKVLGEENFLAALFGKEPKKRRRKRK